MAHAKGSYGHLSSGEIARLKAERRARKEEKASDRANKTNPPPVDPVDPCAGEPTDEGCPNFGERADAEKAE